MLHDHDVLILVPAALLSVLQGAPKPRLRGDFHCLLGLPRGRTFFRA
jgi:hypothetical protein